MSESLERNDHSVIEHFCSQMMKLSKTWDFSFGFWIHYFRALYSTHSCLRWSFCTTRKKIPSSQSLETHLGAILGNHSHGWSTDISGTHTKNLQFPIVAHGVLYLVLSLMKELGEMRSKQEMQKSNNVGIMDLLMFSCYELVRRSYCTWYPGWRGRWCSVAGVVPYRYR
jgi:hypothetical protein